MPSPPQTEQAVAMPHPLVEAFGRPTWMEARAVREAAALKRDSVPLNPGHGTKVVLAPGFYGSETSLKPLGSWLSDAGYDVTLAALERNARASSWAADRIEETLEQSNEPVVLIGHSRGGQQARVVTQRRPELVRQLITLGSPQRAHLPRHFVLRAAVATLQAGSKAGLLGEYNQAAEDQYEAELFSPYDIDVPWTSIWSRTDGIVAWQSCLIPGARSVEVKCSHVGLVASVPAFAAIADELDRLDP